MNIRRRQLDPEKASSTMMINTKSNDTDVEGGSLIMTTRSFLLSMLVSFGIGCALASSFRTPTLTTAAVVHEPSYADAPHSVPVTLPSTSASAHVGEGKRETDDDDGDEDKSKQTALLSCLKNVLWNELPIAKNQEKCTTKDVIFAHHGNAGHWWMWNPVVGGRMKPMKAMDNANVDAKKASGSKDSENDQHEGVRCSVWEVGANVEAEDSRTFLKIYGNCRYHAFEPVPPFYEKLKQGWKDEPRMKVHEYGIGAEDSVIQVTEDDLQGQSTFLADGKGGDIEIRIKTFEYALSQSDGIPTLLHMNCEGCEFDFLPAAKKHGFIDKVPVIQIGWHSYGDVGLGARAWQLCEIRQLLAETHTMTWGLAFGWERWELNKQDDGV